MLTASYEADHQVVARASGTIDDLRPGERRVATLFAREPIPQRFDSVQFDVSALVENPASASSTGDITPISIESSGTCGSATRTVNVRVTNRDDEDHSFTLQAAFLRDGDLVGLAVGVVNDLAPGSTHRKSLISLLGPLPCYDELIVTVDMMVR